MQTKSDKIRKLAVLAMLAAIAFVVVTFIRIPFLAAVPFLKYEPKDIILTICGFVFGPIEAFIVALVVSLVEMFTISSTGIIGFIMNMLSSVAFACTAAVIYKKKKSMGGAVLGLVCGTVIMTAVMLIWNYLITPLYMGVSRGDVSAMLVPAFLPFNLIKGAVNAALTILLYKPLVTALRKAHLLPQSGEGQKRGKISIGLMLTALLVLVTCVLLILVLREII